MRDTYELDAVVYFFFLWKEGVGTKTRYISQRVNKFLQIWKCFYIIFNYTKFFWETSTKYSASLNILRGTHQNPCLITVIQESVNNEVQIVFLVQRRFSGRLEAIDLQLVRLFGLFACIKDVTGVDAVWACWKCGHRPVLSGPRLSDVKATVRLVASPHVPF